MYFHPEERIVILIDGVNLNATHKALDFDIDYKKLLAMFRQRGRLVKALFYTTVFEQQEYSSVRPLVDWLEYNGFTLVTKPAREIIDSEGRRRIRGSMHVEMVVDALRLADSVDHIVLFAGEGGFRSLIEAIQQKGKRVTVVSTLQSRPPMVADELRRQADEFVDLADLEPMIGRTLVQRPVPIVEQHDDDVVDAASDVEASVAAEPGARDSEPSGVIVERRTRTRRPPVK